LAYSKTRTSTVVQNPTHDKIEKLAEEVSSGYIRNLLYASGNNAQSIIDYDTAVKAEASSYSLFYL
jgi:hypothetical protein